MHSVEVRVVRGQPGALLDLPQPDR